MTESPKLILPGQAEILKPGAQAISPAQRKAQAFERAYLQLRQEMQQVVDAHMRIIDWCSENLTPEQMQALLEHAKAKPPH